MTDFLRLVAARPRLSLAAFSAVIVVRLLLWMIPFRVLNRFVSRPMEASVIDQAFQHRASVAVRMASRLVPYASCLTQAIAAKLLFRTRGNDAELCFGMARSNNGQFEAHAWLEKNGKVILGDLADLNRYQRLT